MSQKVSILIPTYNRAHYLREAIQSALNQTYANIEVIILDDASPDHTPQVAAEFSHDPRVRYIRHSKNMGIAENWRAGIKAATGEFFCLLHDDDTFEPKFVEALLLPLVREEGLILAFCDHWVMEAHGSRLKEKTDEVSRQFGRDRLTPGALKDFGYAALVASSLPVGATLFRNSMIPLDFIEEQARGAIDAWLFYQCVKTGRSAFYVNERLMNYRIHHGGMSSSQPIYMSEGHIFRYRALLADTEMASLHAEIKQKLAETLTGYGITLLAEGDSRRARLALQEAVCHQASLRNVLAYGLSCSGAIGIRATARLKAKR